VLKISVKLPYLNLTKTERYTVKQVASNVYDIVSQASRQHIAGQPDVARGPLIEYTAICQWIFFKLWT